MCFRQLLKILSFSPAEKTQGPPFHSQALSQLGWKEAVNKMPTMYLILVISQK